MRGNYLQLLAGQQFLGHLQHCQKCSEEVGTGRRRMARQLEKTTGQEAVSYIHHTKVLRCKSRNEVYLSSMEKTLESSHFESLYPADVRKKEIDSVLSYVTKGGSAQLVGLPGVGRSNLLRFLAYNNQGRVLHLSANYKWFHFVYMDLSEMKGRTSAELIKFILISLSYSLSERKMEEEQKVVNDFLKEAVSFHDELILFQALKRAIDYLSIDHELTVVFLFDRFDAYIPGLEPSFFTNLRVLRNRAKYRFSCVFSLPRPFEEMLEQALYQEFYEFIAGNIVYMSLSDPVSNEFRLSYLEKVTQKKLSSEVKQELLAITGGHGKLLRISAESILAEEKVPEKLNAFLLSKKAVMGSLFEIWDALNPLEQKLIAGTSKDLGEDLYMVMTGLAVGGKIIIPLFEDALGMFPKPTAESISYIPESNEIKQGEESLTEKLSPSEFKLLRFLIQNKDRVCEKEEIITAVWSDDKTQMGVTDQALDQIIYRLRKKIEEDPNLPRHIHTVKGRGYRFSE